MKKVRYFASLAVVLSVLGSNPASENTALHILKQRQRYTLSVALEFSKKNRNAAERVLSMLTDVGPNAYATGFVVGDGLVMTAYHVVSGKLSVSKRRLLGFKANDELQVRAYVNGCPARVVKADQEADLVLLSVCTSPKDAKNPTFQTDPEVNQPIVLIARPHENSQLRRGVFQGPYTFEGKQFWSIKVDAVDGFSGSPVYNEQGEIVGVFCGYDSSERLAFISPSAKAQKFLEEYNAGNP